jgi:hypothetical protein
VDVGDRVEDVGSSRTLTCAFAGALYCAWLVGIPPEAVGQLDRIEAAASS